MLYNYFKVTMRNIWRSKVNSVINILGLSVGIACAILIVLFVKDEVTFDQFHSKIDRLFRVTTSISRDGDGNMEGMTPFVFGLTVKDEIQDVESAIILTSYNDMVENGSNKFRETITIVGADFFNMFDFKVLDGTTSGVFANVSDLVITKEMAEKYFGRTNVAGETLRVNAGGELKDYQVFAVLDNVPSNSSLQFDFLVGDEIIRGRSVILSTCKNHPRLQTEPELDQRGLLPWLSSAFDRWRQWALPCCCCSRRFDVLRVT